MHTSYTDGKATIKEMADSAKEYELKQVLFSEHVRHTSTYYPGFVEELKGLAPENLVLLTGVETKILDVNGTLDCSPEIAAMCDGIVGSVHNPPTAGQESRSGWSGMDPEAAEELEFQLAMAIATRSKAHVLGHPMGMVVTKFDRRPYDRLEELAKACADHDKAFELNARYCGDSLRWTEIVKRAGCKVSFGSDAHNSHDVGSAWRMFAEHAQNIKGPA
jgi:putative hydrolase